MPKFPTFPILLNDCLALNISKFKQWGYLKPGFKISTTLDWSRKGTKIGSIGVTVDMNPNDPFIELDYKHRDKPINYRVYLTSKPSNLNKGQLWFFKCPKTQRKCRKLHLLGSYFFHRTAMTGCFYEKQTYSRNNRKLEKLCETYIGFEKYYELIYKKHFKKYYKGKPTRKFKKYMKAIELGESKPFSERELLYLMK